jgi:hypothetical protein
VEGVIWKKQTSGEIRVFISRKPVEEPLPVAQAHFLRMGMKKTRHREAGQLLARHFLASADDRNELSDDVAGD